MMRGFSLASGLFFFLWIPGISSVDADQISARYEDHRYARIVAADYDDLRAIEAAGGVILNCVPGPGPMEVVIAPAGLAELAVRNLPTEILHEDVAALLAPAPVALGTGNLFDDFFLDYRRYDNGLGSIKWYMDELVARYPALCSLINVGTTLEGRTIWGLRITNDAVAGDKPAVFYYSCVHAREWVTTTVPNYLANYVLSRYATDVTLRDMVDHVEIFLVPVVNIDGYEFSHIDDRLWRKNRRLNDNDTIGVDINRNWGEQWGIDDGGSSPNPSSAVYRGTGPFSEPETAALRDFFLAHPNIRAMNDIHSFSQLILWPFGYTDMLPADQAVYEQVGFGMRDVIFDVHGMAYVPGPVNTTIYPVNGGSVDWTYVQRDVLSFSFELRPDEGPFGQGFLLPPGEIIPNNEEIAPALVYLTNSDWVRSPVILNLVSPLPEVITPGVDTVMTLQVQPQYESPVPGSPRMYYRYAPDQSYQEATLTPLGSNGSPLTSNGYAAVLPATHCGSDPEFYFAVDGDAGSIVTHPRPGMDAPFRLPVASGAFFVETMDTDPGWDTEGDWAWGQPTGAGVLNADPTGGFTGTNVYGYNLAGDYTNMLPATYLTTPPVDCTGRFDVSLRFHRWLGVESNFNFDEATVEVSSNGVDWTVVWRATDTGVLISDRAWVFEAYDLSAIVDDEPAVQIRWGMGPTDGSTTLPGWNIDDVVLFSRGCEPTLGDYNGDSVVNAADFTTFPDCQQELVGELPSVCAIFDFNGDAAIDLHDYAAFQRALVE